MLELLWIIPAFPLFGFLTITLFRRWLSTPQITVLGCGSVGISAALAIYLSWSFVTSPPPGDAYTQVLWTWINVAGFTPKVAFYLDALSIIMILVVTGVGFLIHVYSTEYMETDEAYGRFFAYMNLFIASMLILVLADDLLLLYLGWEGVGLCSYLLIGFWYKKPENGRAARKAFLVTRVGDTAMAIGLFLLFRELGTLEIQEVLTRATVTWKVGSAVAVTAAALLLGGALGKSGQLPLQTWLPDAMAGPTPVSALIHAATMVTAGVYLIARTHVIFTLAPIVQSTLAIIGVVTALVAGFSALTQRDIKRILAYSTISQIGYMFLALGVGAWAAAMFHFMTHAFFKALLFMAAGAVILSLHHEQDIFKMGGLRKRLPVSYWSFLAGGAALAGFPLFTAGFYSKDLILWNAWASKLGSPWLWGAGVAGAFLTGLYTFRLIFRVFWGTSKTPVTHLSGVRVHLPLMILALLSIVAGFIELPHSMGHVTIFSSFMETALPKPELVHSGLQLEALLQAIVASLVLLGIGLAYLVFVKKPEIGNRIGEKGAGRLLHGLWAQGWGFDWLYDHVLVRPFVWIAHGNRKDFIDWVYNFIGRITILFHSLVSLLQGGKVRWYAMGIVTGTAIVLSLAVFR